MGVHVQEAALARGTKALLQNRLQGLGFLDCVDWRLAADKAGLGSVQYGRTVPVIFGFRL